MIKFLFKTVLTVVVIFFFLFASGFCFDYGTDLEIAGRVITVMAIFGLILSVIWLSEIREYRKNHSFGQIVFAVIKYIIGLMAIIALTMFVEW